MPSIIDKKEPVHVTKLQVSWNTKWGWAQWSMAAKTV